MKLNIGNEVELYNDLNGKWEYFIICCEEDLKMIKTKYKERVRILEHEKKNV